MVYSLLYELFLISLLFLIRICRIRNAPRAVRQIPATLSRGTTEWRGPCVRRGSSAVANNPVPRASAISLRCWLRRGVLPASCRLGPHLCPRPEIPRGLRFPAHCFQGAGTLTQCQRIFLSLVLDECCWSVLWSKSGLPWLTRLNSFAQSKLTDPKAHRFIASRDKVVAWPRTLVGGKALSRLSRRNLCKAARTAGRYMLPFVPPAAKGFVCRKRMNHGRPNDDLDAAMSSTSFLNCLRCNLLEVGEDPRPYGTHSFRRGGCQYLAITLRWSIRQICAWGSWANRQESNTVFKYLLSFVDEVDDREHYFNKSRQTGTMCLACRRSYNCAR